MKIKEEQNYTYLGRWLSYIRNDRIVKDDHGAGVLNTLITSKDISRKAKIHLYKCILRPLGAYRYQTCLMRDMGEEDDAEVET